MILLTEKDADFIANIARRDLGRIKSSFDEVTKLIENERENLEKKLSLLESDELRNEYKEKSETTYSAVKNNLGKHFFSVMQDYTKIIDLATVGSRLLEDKND